jgi:hypothetical protein
LPFIALIVRVEFAVFSPACTGSKNPGDAVTIKLSVALLILKSANAQTPLVVHTSIGWNPDNPVGTEIVSLHVPEAEATIPEGTGMFFPPNIIFAIPTPGENPLADNVTDEPTAPADGFTNKSAIVNALNESAPYWPAKLDCIVEKSTNPPDESPIKF